MHRSCFLWVVIASSATPCFSQPMSADGDWNGRLLNRGAETPVVVHLKTAGGKLEGTLDVGLHLAGFELISLRQDAGKLHFEQPDIKATFDGGFQGSQLVGKFNIFGGSFDVALQKAKAEPPRFTQQDVEIANGAVRLSGTVVLPTSSGPHPAIVFTHPSGPTKRSEARYLAFHLARRGIASLIYDKRGAGASAPGVSWGRASFEDLAEDALAGVRLLQGRQDIKAKQVGLFGHSQGGWISTFAAKRSRDVAFLIMSSGPAVAVWKMEDYRVEHQLRANGFSEEAITEALQLVKQKFEVAQSGEGWDELNARLQKARNEKWLTFIDPPQSLDRLRENWRRISSYDPLPHLQKVICPVLALYGERDNIVPVQESSQALEKALKKGGNHDLTIRVFARADHDMFVSSDPGEPWFWPHLADGYLDALDEWLKSHGMGSRAQ